MSLDHYRRVQTLSASPRATEHRLMSEITSEMIAARDMGMSGAGLMPALHRNREVWSAFSSLCATEGNQLPPDLRASIISLALWVDRFTTEVVTGRDHIDELIDVNRAIIAGLAGAPQAHAA
ncbi:flagellar biosynthesis regulator FlaF [Iodidimonas sp. SYSU 1G8]|uniref:flagellar biosynthesis regulator FlaF n=1 Tax=Iodidimonas sp. SYSU 1G8 TaxID=3133967 RepID=UPI0031FF457B